MERYLIKDNSKIYELSILYLFITFLNIIKDYLTNIIIVIILILIFMLLMFFVLRKKYLKITIDDNYISRWKKKIKFGIIKEVTFYSWCTVIESYDNKRIRIYKRENNEQDYESIKKILVDRTEEKRIKEIIDEQSTPLRIGGMAIGLILQQIVMLIISVITIPIYINLSKVLTENPYLIPNWESIIYTALISVSIILLMNLACITTVFMKLKKAISLLIIFRVLSIMFAGVTIFVELMFYGKFDLVSSVLMILQEIIFTFVIIKYLKSSPRIKRTLIK